MNELCKTLEPVWRAYSGEAAWQAVADLSRFHRIQASPGYRQAAEWVHGQLIREGIAAEILTYPANEQTSFLAWPSFQEWSCSSATLRLVNSLDETTGWADLTHGALADYRACPLSIIQRSAPFEGEIELVLVQDGLQASDYDGLDVSGKAVLSRGQPRRVWEMAVQQRGAAGILFDGMRTVPPVRLEGDLLDVRQYTSFWWKAGEPRCFGFVLTPRLGQSLRYLLQRSDKPVRLHVQVESSFCDGTLEVVSAVIPGQTDREVLVVTHLCHPQPSANDNASGAAAVLEAARTLRRLIAEGELAHPQRTIRFLWVPEMTGTAAYVAGREANLSGIIAGLNLDMVGEDQDQTGSSWLIEHPPDSAASFAPDLLACLRDELAELPGMVGIARHHTGTGRPAHLLYRQAEVPFGGGSDHYILSDPSVGVPTPMLNQWPDRFYHTSADTPDRTDPHSLARAGALAAGYAYWLATASVPEATWLGYQMLARFKVRVVAVAQTAVGQAMACYDAAEITGIVAGLDRRLAYLLDRQQAALRTLARLGPVECLIVDLLVEAERLVAHELKWAQGAAALHAAAANLALPGPGESPAEQGVALSLQQDRERHLEDELERQAAKRIPHRLMRGPIPIESHLERLPEAARQPWRQLLEARSDEASEAMTTLALYWADGARSVLDIAGLVELETGQPDLELVSKTFEILQALGFVSLQEVA